MTFQEFVHVVISPQADKNGNSVSLGDYSKDGMEEYPYPKKFVVDRDTYSWWMGKRHTKGRNLCNHYELWFVGKCFTGGSQRIATGDLTKSKVRKGFKVIYTYYEFERR